LGAYRPSFLLLRRSQALAGEGRVSHLTVGQTASAPESPAVDPDDDDDDDEQRARARVGRRGAAAAVT